MKKICIFLFLLVFSFYFTYKLTNDLKENDSLMQEIKKEEEKYSVKAVNAEIIDNEIISGKNGQTIDYQKTYQNMKQYGAYNESLIVTKNIKPTISIENNYDKYLIRGNKSKRQIALVFPVYENNIENILKILKKNNIKGTLFIDGTFLEKNISLFQEYPNNEYEILSYNKKYQVNFFKTAISYLESITNKDAKYCYTEEENEELLNICKNIKLHTIKPTIIIKNNLLRNIKNNLDNAQIISIKPNNYTEKELETTINYIKGKNYDLVLLDTLLSEV